MAESIREVIARMKSTQKPSPSSVKAVPTPIPKPEKVVPQEVEEVEEEVVDEINDQVDEETPKVEEENQEAEIPIEQRISMEVEMLQNDGRFRVELLHQLQEINKALVVVAGVLVDLANKDGKA